jgi:REP element-mobilizing transposase RayT
LASIIRGFKIGVTQNARLINPRFAWQSRYHDHIIRDKTSFERIAAYIKNNPADWKKDKFY